MSLNSCAKKKIRRRKYPYGESLFFVKEKENLRAVVDYRALNFVKKRKQLLAELIRNDLSPLRSTIFIEAGPKDRFSSD